MANAPPRQSFEVMSSWMARTPGDLVASMGQAVNMVNAGSGEEGDSAVGRNNGTPLDTSEGQEVSLDEDEIPLSISQEQISETQEPAVLDDEVAGAPPAKATHSYLRMDDEAKILETRCTFNPLEAAKAFVYELAPPICISPILCMFLEPSMAQGLNVARHRQYIPTTLSGANPPLATLFDCVVHWIVTSSLVLWIITPNSTVDMWELLLAYSWMCTRWAVIATKYGYYTQNMLGEMRKPISIDNSKSLVENLILVSWASPTIELLEKVSVTGQEIAKVDLNSSFMRFSSEEADTFRQRQQSSHSDNEFTPTQACKTGVVNAGELFAQLLIAGFSTTLSNVQKNSLTFGIVVMAFFPSIVRWWYGLDVFGSSYVDYYIYAGMIVSQGHGAQSSLRFCLTATLDLKRRSAVLSMLNEMIQYPGIEFQKLFRDASFHPSEPSHMFLNFEEGNNAYLWLLIRRSVRVAGYNFYIRGMSYIGICVGWAIAATLVLNLIVFTESKHHVASLGAIMIGILAITLSVQVALRGATSLQYLIPMHRLTLKEKLVELNHEVVQYESQLSNDHLPGKKTSRISSNHPKNAIVSRLKALQKLYISIEECMAFEEEVARPARVFGIDAGPGLTTAVFGVVIAGIAAASQQQATANFKDRYDQDGRFEVQYDPSTLNGCE